MSGIGDPCERARKDSAHHLTFSMRAGTQGAPTLDPSPGDWRGAAIVLHIPVMQVCSLTPPLRCSFHTSQTTSFRASQATSIGGHVSFRRITTAWTGCFGLLRFRCVCARRVPGNWGMQRARCLVTVHTTIAVRVLRAVVPAAAMAAAPVRQAVAWRRHRVPIFRAQPVPGPERPT